MKTKNKLIISLITFAVILFCVISFFIIPGNERRQNEYETKQQDSLTHNVTVIQNFKNSILGDAPNISNLFTLLPLGDVNKKFQIDYEKNRLIVNYLDTVDSIGEEKVGRDLVYNTVAAMATIDNLSTIVYHFSGNEFSFTRTQIERVFGTNLSGLLNEKDWKEKVQCKMGDENFIKQFYGE